MKVIVDRDQCEANALCVATAPEVFQLNDDDELTILREHPDDDALPLVRKAVAACPKQALRLVDE
jgi:ferredoxin